MSRTVTALYDSRAEAESARQRLSSTVDVERIRIIDQGSGGSGGGSSGGLGNAALSHEDRHAYGEGIRRGGFLLCAEVDGHEDADRIVQALEETSSVDLDQRQESWRSEGWQPYQASSGSAGSNGAQSAIGAQASTGTQASGNVVEEQRIPIIEEELRVGKREVERGGARVRSYVREVPVHEEVTLREEHVHVERRPVNQQLARGELDRDGGLLQDRTVEMKEHAEEAVVGKEAVVREEVVLSKTVEQRSEQIDETVRHTEVDVEEGAVGTGSADRSAFGGFGDGSNSGNNNR